MPVVKPVLHNLKVYESTMAFLVDLTVISVFLKQTWLYHMYIVL